MIIGLLAALNSQPHRIIRYCTRHIIGNIKHRFKSDSPKDLDAIMYRLQGAESSSEFSSILQTLGMTHPEVSEYVVKIDTKKWCMFELLNMYKLYGWRTTNFVESTNGAALRIRFLHPMNFFQSIMDKVMEQATSRNKMSTQWIAEKRVITEYAQDQLQKQEKQALFHEVRNE